MSGKFYKSLFNQLKIGIVYQDTDGNIKGSNSAATEITGLKASQMQKGDAGFLGLNPFKKDLTPLPGEECPPVKAIKTGKPAELDFMGFYHAKTGNPVWTSVKSVPEFKPGRSKPSRIYSVLTDITEQCKTENSLHQVLKIEQTLAAISAAFLAREEPDSNIDFALKKLGMLTDADRIYLFQFLQEEALMNNTHEWCAPGISSQKENLQHLPFKTVPWWIGKLKNHETIEIRDVSTLPEEARAEREILEAQDIKAALVFPVTVNNQVSGFLGFDNVTEIRQWSTEAVMVLKRASEIIGNALERQQSHEHIRKQNRDLREARARAEESDRLKSAFLANMSHEIRTPIHSILGFSNLLEEEQPDTERQQSTRLIREGAERVLIIINNLIDISKIETGQMQLFKRETDIHEKLQSLYDSLKPEASQKGLRLKLCNQSLHSPFRIITDGDKLQAILMNLLGNAIKYTEQGNISFGYELADQGLRFFVQDTGIGIPEKQQQIIFERFGRANPDPYAPREGAGLGLSIAKAYIEMMGGEIWVETREGKGSTFYFTIPYQEKTTKTHPSGQQDAGAEGHTSPWRILIAAQPSPASQEIDESLQNTTARIEHAENTTDFIVKSLRNPDFNIILIDYDLFRAENWSIIAPVKEFNPSVVLVALSERERDSERQNALDAGFDAYAAKPLDKYALEQIIKAVENVRSSR